MAKRNILEELKEELKEAREMLQYAEDDRQRNDGEREIAKLEKLIADTEAAKSKVKKEKPAPKPKAEHEEKPKPKNPQPSDLEVGEEMGYEDGTRIKRTAKDTYILLYKGDPKDDVVITRKGVNWEADCCSKRGILYSDLDKAAINIIEAKQCAEEMERRIEAAKVRAKAREQAEKKSTTTKVKETLERAATSIENKTEDDTVAGSASATKDYVTEITNIVKAIEDGITEKAARKAFIKSLISKLEKELETI